VRGSARSRTSAKAEGATSPQIVPSHHKSRFLAISSRRLLATRRLLPFSHTHPTLAQYPALEAPAANGLTAMSTSADDHEDQIYDSARQCEIGFKKLLSALEGLDGNGRHRPVIRDSYHRFKLWAGSIGAFAERQVSLDTRLRFYLDVKNVVLRLLKLLETNLYHGAFNCPSLNIATGSRPQAGRNQHD
jgi:hypothetical protein